MVQKKKVFFFELHFFHSDTIEKVYKRKKIKVRIKENNKKKEGKKMKKY